jgi:hypothetical protein
MDGVPMDTNGVCLSVIHLRYLEEEDEIFEGNSFLCGCGERHFGTKITRGSQAWLPECLIVNLCDTVESLRQVLAALLSEGEDDGGGELETTKDNVDADIH